jgi:hypothetical protein
MGKGRPCFPASILYFSGTCRQKKARTLSKFRAEEKCRTTVIMNLTSKPGRFAAELADSDKMRQTSSPPALHAF